MSKAEEKAMQYCCTKCANNKLNCGMKLISHGRNCIECSNYIEGYHQAEQDLALTWKDVRLLCDKFMDVGLKSNYLARSKEFYEEVLKRYNKTKGNQ